MLRKREKEKHDYTTGNAPITDGCDPLVIHKSVIKKSNITNRSEFLSVIL